MYELMMVNLCTRNLAGNFQDSVEIQTKSSINITLILAQRELELKVRSIK
jgi:hypothetical protein